MRPITTDDPVAWCVSLSVTRLQCAKTAEHIEVLFEVETQRPNEHYIRLESRSPAVHEGVGCGLCLITLAFCI